jgi:hypothetical protein
MAIEEQVAPVALLAALLIIQQLLIRIDQIFFSFPLCHVTLHLLLHRRRVNESKIEEEGKGGWEREDRRHVWQSFFLDREFIHKCVL